MKKSLVALAIFGAFASVAQAQSAVVIYGSFDGGVREVINNVTSAGVVTSDNKTTVGSTGNYYSNRLGFKGTEDLGNGLNAHFALEAGFNTGTGASADANRLFNRAANVGIGGAFGSLDIGRQYSVSYDTIGKYDPFNYHYTGIIPVAATNGAAAGGTAVTSGPNVDSTGKTLSNFGGNRFDNDIKYTGTFNGVTLRAEYAPGEIAGAASTRSSEAVGLAYAAGPFSVGAAYTRKKIAKFTTTTVGTVITPDPINASTPSFVDKAWTVGGAYNPGPFRIAAGFNNEKIDGATNAGVAAVGDAKQRIIWLGGSYLVSPALEVTAAWYQTRLDTPATTAVAFSKGKKDLAIVGVTYSLSKRTSLYGDIDTAKVNGNLDTGAKNRTTGLSAGISHLF